MFLAAVPNTMNINFKLKELKRYGWLIVMKAFLRKRLFWDCRYLIMGEVKTLNLSLNPGTMEHDSPDSSKIVMWYVVSC